MKQANPKYTILYGRLSQEDDCGETMVLHRTHTMDAVKNNFMCSTYRKCGKEVCTIQLAAIILDDLGRVSHFARQQEAFFISTSTGKPVPKPNGRSNGSERKRMLCAGETRS